MSIWAKERPGVYSDYDTSGIVWSSPGGHAVGIAAPGNGELLRTYTITRIQDAQKIFGASSQLASLCAAALQNGAAQVTAVPVKESQPDYPAAFTVLQQESVCALVCGSENPLDHAALKKSVLDASAQNRERVGIVCYFGEEKEAWAAEMNCERMVLLVQRPSNLENCASFAAAALAGRIAGLAAPGDSLNGVSLEGGYPLMGKLSEDEVDALVKIGITPLENAAGQAVVIRAVTSKTTTGGIPDLSFKELSTVLIADHVIQAVRSALEQMLPGARNSARTRAAFATQAAVILEEKQRAGMIESYQRPLCYAEDSDPACCVVEISFHILRGLNQILVAAHIQI